MARWLVQLDGEAFDLQEYPYWFPNGDICAVREGDNVYLVGAAFETLDHPGAVRERAIQTEEEFSAIIALLWPSLKRPRVGTVYREADDGARTPYVFLSGSARGRLKARATLSVGGAKQERPSPTQAQTLLQASRGNAHLQNATLIWADETRTWPRLYRILEEIERFLGRQASTAGLCSNAERRRFVRSANTAEVAGKDARHALGRFESPSEPMNLSEATGFIRNLLAASLRRAGDPPASMSSLEHG